jgi:hypothetical protein
MVKVWSAKNKIYIFALLWVIVSFVVISYGFNIVEKANTNLISSIAVQKNELAQLKAERKNYQLTQQDLAFLGEQPIQPEAFFSKDITLVKEIEALESMASRYSVELVISGVSGTINTAPKYKAAKSDLYAIPYNLSIKGALQDSLNFIENLENLNFLTSVNGLSVSAASGNIVNVGLGAFFYLSK